MSPPSLFALAESGAGNDCRDRWPNGSRARVAGLPFEPPSGEGAAYFVSTLPILLGCVGIADGRMVAVSQLPSPTT